MAPTPLSPPASSDVCRWVLIVAEVQQGRTAGEETAKCKRTRDDTYAGDKCVDRPIGGVEGEKSDLFAGDLGQCLSDDGRQEWSNRRPVDFESGY